MPAKAQPQEWVLVQEQGGRESKSLPNLCFKARPVALSHAVPRLPLPAPASPPSLARTPLPHLSSALTCAAVSFGLSSARRSIASAEMSVSEYRCTSNRN